MLVTSKYTNTQFHTRFENEFEGDFVIAENQMRGVVSTSTHFFAFNPFSVNAKSVTIPLGRPVQTNYATFNSHQWNTQFIREDIQAHYSEYQMSENVKNQIVNILLTIPIYTTDEGGASDYGMSNAYPYENVEVSGMLAPNNVPVSSNVNDWRNLNGDTFTISIDNATYTGKRARGECMGLYNLIQYGIDNNLFDADDELKDFIENSSTSIESDLSVKWDIWYSTTKEKQIINVTDEVTIRWKCKAVDKATLEYLADNPTYPYTDTLTKIIIKASSSPTFGSIMHEVAQVPYGSLEYKAQADAILTKANISDFMKKIGEVLPVLDTGDAYIWLQMQFGDVGKTTSALCVGQMPVNNVTGNVGTLYAKAYGKDGSTITLHYGTPDGVSDDVQGWNDDARKTKKDDTQKYDEDTSDVISDISRNSNISLLTNTYACSEAQIRSLGRKLWDDSFLDNIQMINNDPIQNIIAVKSFPFPLSGGTNKSIVLGNVDMGVHGNELPMTFNPILNIGSFTIPKKFNDGVHDWLDYQTSVIIYLPYIGFQELDIRKVLGKTCNLKYIYDPICGVCTACVYADGIEFAKFSGTIAIDIPITASNRSTVEVGYINGALGSLGKLVTGHPLQALGQAWNSFSSNQNQFTTNGSPSASCDAFDEQRAFVIIDRPVYYEPNTYAHDNGYPCNLTLTLGNYKGFTKCANVDIDNIGCTEEERKELKSLLESGVYF